MSRIPDKPEPEILPSRLVEEEERDWAIDVPSPPPRLPLPPALATKREALQKRPPRIKVPFSLSLSNLANPTISVFQLALSSAFVCTCTPPTTAKGETDPSGGGEARERGGGRGGQDQALLQVEEDREEKVLC